MNNFSLMARFNAWINGRLYESVAGLSDDAYRNDRKAYFGSVHNTLNHLLVVDRLWTGRIEGVDRGVRALDEILYDDFAGLRAARAAEDDRMIAFVDGLDAARLRAPVRYRRMLGTGEQVTRCDHILLTLFNHQTHHRGQVHCMLTQSGVVPPPLDLVYFLEEIGLS
ncbi:MAG: DinB family protein [Alphaproteobacteria bacterium]